MRQKFWVTVAACAAALAIIMTGLVWVYGKVVPFELSKPPAISGKQIEHLSPSSVNELTDILYKEKLVVAISVVQASLIKNQRRTIFFMTDDQQLREARDEWLEKKDQQATMSLFGSTQQELNSRVADIFNGNFVCTQFKDTIAFQLWPKGAESAPWVCATPIPPGFDGSGDFTGYINVYFSEKPSDNEKARFAKRIAEISTNIYKRDVENTPAK